MKTGNEFKRVVEALDGSDGVVYLMFLGREKYVGEIQGPLVKSEFYAHKESVNQSFSRITKKGYGDLFLRFVRQENSPGRPKIYTANFNPIFVTLKESSVEFDEERLKAIFTTFSFLNDGFPRYLVKRFSIIPSFQKKIPWKYTLSSYLTYLALNILPSIIKRSREEVREKLMKILSPTKDFGIPLESNRIDERIEEFLTRYPGGLKSFAKDIWETLLKGSFYLIFGPTLTEMLTSTLRFVLDALENSLK